MYQRIKELAEEALKLQNKNAMDEALKQIVSMIDESTDFEAYLSECELAQGPQILMGWREMDTKLAENFSDEILISQVECLPVKGGYGLIAELMKRYEKKIVAACDEAECAPQYKPETYDAPKHCASEAEAIEAGGLRAPPIEPRRIYIQPTGGRDLESVFSGFSGDTIIVTDSATIVDGATKQFFDATAGKYVDIATGEPTGFLDTPSEAELAEIEEMMSAAMTKPCEAAPREAIEALNKLASKKGGAK